MNKICMGIWGNTNLPDRFNVKGFGEFVPVIDRIRQVGGLEDVDGIELHLPTEINDSNANEIESVLDLFPYRDDPAEFIKLSVENLRFAQRVVSLMNERGVSELRESGEKGPAMARLLLQCIGDAR